MHPGLRDSKCIPDATPAHLTFSSSIAAWFDAQALQNGKQTGIPSLQTSSLRPATYDGHKRNGSHDAKRKLAPEGEVMAAYGAAVVAASGAYQLP
jgi:hypothetical protein